MALFSRSPSLKGLTVRERFQLVRAIGAVEPERPFLVTSRLTIAMAAHPDELVYRLMLVDYLCRDNELVRAVRESRELSRVVPTDPRGSYAHASTVRMLTHAKYAAPEYRERLAGPRLMFASFGERFDPDNSVAALADLGMSLSEAVDESVEAFLETLRRGVRRNERRLVTDCLVAMNRDFPTHEIMRRL